MELRYDDLTKKRLRHWRATDPLLFAATEQELVAIKSAPHAYGQDGSPHVPRLISYAVPGRDDQYVITWEVQGELIFIGDISSATELAQRARRRRKQ